MALVVAMALGYVPYHLYGSSGLLHYVELRRERDALHAANLAQYRQNQRLRTELGELTDEDGKLSRSAVERAARDELGLVKPGEIVFKLADRPLHAAAQAAR